MNQQIVVPLLVVALVVAVLLIFLGMTIIRAGSREIHLPPPIDSNSRMTKEESNRAVVEEWLSTLREDDDGV